jgi:DNA-directed RNA polymerase specialized sigma24 family protein
MIDASEMPRVASFQRGSSLEGEPFAPECVLRIYAEIRTVCRICGLAAADAEDVANEIWLCLLCRPELMAGGAHRIRGVAHNYIRRFWRRRSRERYREGTGLESVDESCSAGEAERLESKIMVDELASRLPEAQARLLELLRSGHTLATAARVLGAPRGSRDYLGKQLVCRSRRLLRRPATARKT